MTTESAPVKEGSAEIQFDSSVFYNPIQEFNRDMSVAAIKVWSEMFLGEIYTRKTKQEPPYKDFDQIILPEYHGDDSLKRKNLEKVQKQLFALNQKFLDSGLKMVDLGHSSMKEYHFSIMEGLAASGLRSIRYAKEISNVKEIIANDYSRDAVEAIKRNAERNGVSGLVKAVQGDASQTLYKALGEGNKYSVIDLDPYGSAAPFLDGAIQAVKNGGCVAFI